MMWDRDSTAPDGNGPRGISVVGTRLRALEMRVSKLEERWRATVFLLAMAALVIVTICLTKGSPSP